MGGRLVYKSYRFRLYPKEEQIIYFEEMFKCCRVVYNHFLEMKIKAYEAKRHDPSVHVPTRFDMCKLLTTFKKTETNKEGTQYLTKVDSTSLVYELKNLEDAFNRFFKRMKQGVKDPGYPNFKGARDKDSATFAFKKKEAIERNKIKFAKIGWVNA